jgi:3-phenylpropionate/cinnamic acid dioxygenase small subunit
MQIDDKLAIHELLARSAYALDQRQVEMLEDTFSAAATLTIDIAGTDGEAVFEGRDAIMGLMRESMETQTDQRRHVVTNVFFEQQTDDRATVISNLTITSVEHGTIRLVTSGLYRDAVIREEGRWRIAGRRIELDMAY